MKKQPHSTWLPNHGKIDAVRSMAKQAHERFHRRAGNRDGGMRKTYRSAWLFASLSGRRSPPEAVYGPTIAATAQSRPTRLRVVKSLFFFLNRLTRRF
jgi:hypothetical protein